MREITKSMPNTQLKLARERHGWSQRYVAQEVGTDAFTVSRWERGVTLPSPHFRQQLSMLFAVSVSELGLLGQQALDEDTGLVSADETPSQPEALFDPAIPPLPVNERSLVGRDDLLRQLKLQLLSGEGKHLSHIAFHGLPGVGKTALATMLAYDEEVRAHFCDGVLWAGLGTTTDLMGVLERWAMVLNVTLPERTPRNHFAVLAERIHAAIGQRHMLLVIDDAWDLQQTLALQLGGEHCTHLVTTRLPEIAQRFAPEKALTVRELADSDARLLLMRLAPVAVQAEPEEVQALTAVVGGLPLALTLLGNYLRVQTYSGQPRRLRLALERLRNAEERLQLSEPQTVIGAHPNLAAGTPLSLQAVIGMSDRQISEQARTALRALALFPPKPNTFAEEAALAITALPVETLDALMDAGLLESSGAGRYTLHQTITDYAQPRIIETQATERFVRYFVAYVESHAVESAAIIREQTNIAKALEMAFAAQLLPALLQGVRAFVPLLINRGSYKDAETHLQHLLDLASSGKDAYSQEGQITAWLYYGKVAEQRAEYDAASNHWQRGLTLARQQGLERLAAELLLELGMLARQQGQPEQALQFFQQALSHAQLRDDQYLSGVALRNLGVLARERGEPEQAQQFTREALAIFQQLGHQHEIARTLNSLGILARRQGEPEQACLYYERALTIFRQVGDQRGAATSLGNLSRIVVMHQGDMQRAHQLYREALALFEQLGDLRSCAQILHGLGSLMWELGEPGQANQFLQKSLQMLREIGDQHTVALTLGELGIQAREQAQFELAQQLLDEAYRLLLNLQDRREASIALRELGALALAQDRLEQANSLLQEALTAIQGLNDRRELAMTLREVGILARKQGRYTEAAQTLQEALVSLRALNDRRMSALTLRELGLLARERGQEERAEQCLQEALQLLHTLGDLREYARCQYQLGLLYWRSGNLQEALPALLKAGIGFQSVQAPDIRGWQADFIQLHTSMDETAYKALCKRVAAETVDTLYQVEQTTWAESIAALSAIHKQDS